MSLKTTEPVNQIQKHCTFFFIIVFVFRSKLRYCVLLPFPLPLGFSEQERRTTIQNDFYCCRCDFLFLLFFVFFNFQEHVKGKLQSNQQQKIRGITIFRGPSTLFHLVICKCCVKFIKWFITLKIVFFRWILKFLMQP